MEKKYGEEVRVIEMGTEDNDINQPYSIELYAEELM